MVRALTCNDRRHREGKLDPIKGKVMTTAALHSMLGIDHFTDPVRRLRCARQTIFHCSCALPLDLLRRFLDRQAFSPCHEDRSES